MHPRSPLRESDDPRDCCSDQRSRGGCAPKNQHTFQSAPGILTLTNGPSSARQQSPAARPQPPLSRHHGTDGGSTLPVESLGDTGVGSVRWKLTRPTPLDRWTSTMTVSSVAPVAPCCYMSGPRRWRSAAESRRSHALRRHHHHGGDQRHVPQARHRHHGRRHLQVLACSRPFPPSLTARLCGSTPPVVNARRSTDNPLFSATPRNCTRHATHTTHARHA